MTSKTTRLGLQDCFFNVISISVVVLSASLMDGQNRCTRKNLQPSESPCHHILCNDSIVGFELGISNSGLLTKPYLRYDIGTGYEYDGNVFVAWVLQVRRAEVVTKWSTGFRTWTPILRKLITYC